MPVRPRALIIEKDEEFADRLQRCLKLLELPVARARNRREALDNLETRGTALVFIAVERPTKTGFRLFSDVKRLLRNVPIVLGSSTVPMDELLLHQKLRLHADAYVDKRGLSDREILATLSGVLRLELDPEELSSMARRTRSQPADAVRSDPLVVLDDDTISTESDQYCNSVLGDADPELDDLLRGMNVSPAEIDTEQATREEGFEEEEDLPEQDSDINELQDEVLQLQRELDHARRSASSSPFSTDYLELRERAEAGERGKARLRREIVARARQIEALRAKLLQIAGRLLQAERSRDLLSQQVRELTARTVPLEDELRIARSHQEELGNRLQRQTERWEALNQNYTSEIESFEKRLAVEAQLAAQANRRFDAARAEAAEQIRDRLDEQAAQLKKEYDAESAARAEAELQERTAALEAQQAFSKRELDELRRGNQHELETCREQHRKLLAELQSSTEQALLRKDREMQQGLAEAEARAQLDRQRAAELEVQARNLRETHARALEVKDTETAEKLDVARREQASALESQRDEHRMQCEQMTASHERALDERDRQHQRALERTLTDAQHETGERRTALEQIEIGHRRAIDEMEQRHTERLESIKKLHEDERQRMQVEQEAALAGREATIREEQERVAATRQAEWQAKVDEMCRKQAQTLAAEREEMQKVIEAGTLLERQRASEFELQARKAQEAHALALDALASDHQAQLERLAASNKRDLEERDQRHQNTLTNTGQEQLRESQELQIKLAQIEIDHRNAIADIEHQHRDQVERIEKLHGDELEQLQVKHRCENERMRTAHEATVVGLEGKIREEQERAAATRQEEWQAQLNEMRQEQAQTLAAEREEMQVIIDALEAVKGVDSALAVPVEAVAEPTVPVDEAPVPNSTVLRRLAEEMDSLDANAAEAADETPEQPPSSQG